ncbi:hypothetical protein PILCRDRAFT_413885 [Piloderma croceum F 1598]|uniref:Uncharacterized protein n=1 Tax=Piloderma croceum (strain F 1598) TaxID=765440 RepID=A0A0C3FZW6_PILCF|nr:hypothetical protein PILCRDRAFT_413885 [Piloderma croceum F 1598]
MCSNDQELHLLVPLLLVDGEHVHPSLRFSTSAFLLLPIKTARISTTRKTTVYYPSWMYIK